MREMRENVFLVVAYVVYAKLMDITMISSIICEYAEDARLRE